MAFFMPPSPGAEIDSAAQRRRQRNKRLIVAGISCMAAGYLALAVPPESESTTVLIRITLGFALLFAGFVLSFYPAFERLFDI